MIKTYKYTKDINLKKLIPSLKQNLIKSSDRKVSWFGAKDYSYVGAFHEKQSIPIELFKISFEIERLTEVPFGYYNSCLVNFYPKFSKGIPKHKDNESIFRDKDLNIGSIAVLTLGNSNLESTISIHDNYLKISSLRIKNNDVYVMPSGRFQDDYFHEVHSNNENRISLTFRHIPNPEYPLIVKGNLYTKELEDIFDYVGFTSNSCLNGSKLVMGRGNALEMKKWKEDIDLKFGKEINHLESYSLKFINNIFAFQTKIHFRNKTPLDLLHKSLKMLKEKMIEEPSKTFALPIPAISNGGMKKNEVLEIIANYDFSCNLVLFEK